MGDERTEQEKFWAGGFGDEYIERNRSEELLAANHALFAEVLQSLTAPPDSVLEIGANIGMNLKALRNLLPTAILDGVEINTAAAEELRSLSLGKVFEESIFEFDETARYDLVFTKTVLIHMPPERLTEVYAAMGNLSTRYVLIAEYYNPVPVSVRYRGHEERLFKRDFASEFLEQNTDFQLRDYGFVYHLDPAFPQDDITWFLMARSQ